MRQAIVLILIVSGIMNGVAAVLTIYVRDTVIDSNEFASRTADAFADPAVGNLIAIKVVESDRGRSTKRVSGASIT